MAHIPSALLLTLLLLSGYAVAELPDPEQTFDLGSLHVEYYPTQASSSDKPAPVLVYVTGGFWGMDTEGDLHRTARGSLRLTQMGLEIALVDTDPNAAPDQWLDDLARLIVRLRATQLNKQPARIYLLGHSSGAQLPLMLAYQPERLARHGLQQSDIAGVISLSGILNLATDLPPVEDLLARRNRVFGDDRSDWARMSPAHLDTSTGPSLMLLTAQQDLAGLGFNTQRLATLMAAKRRPGITYQVVPNKGHLSIGDLGQQDNFATMLVLAMTKVRPLPGHFPYMVAMANTRVLYPHWDSDQLWEQYGDLVETYPVDERFRQHVLRLVSEDQHQLSVLPMRVYHAIPLARLAERLDPKARYLVTRNTRDEVYHWRSDLLDDYDGQLVIGIDEEHNLFRYGIAYQAKREFSWVDREQPMPLMMRNLGASVFFRKPPPDELHPRALTPYSITAQGISVDHSSPVERYADLPEELVPAFTWKNGCFSCHKLRGIGSRSHQNLSSTGAPHGGYALDLEAYPPDVWKRFVFNQKLAADMIGAVPNMVDEAQREPLYELVNREREAAGK